MQPKITVLGKNGQIASAFAETLDDAVFIDSEELDLSIANEVYAKLEEFNVNSRYIINCMAYTAVDKAESEQELCDTINHKSVAEIARFCKDKNITLVHYSTDYVFDGSGDLPFAEDDNDKLKPLSIYGKTKLLGEQVITASGCEYFILRTSWVYSHSGNNFAKTMLRLGAERDTLSVVNDQIGSPSYASDIANNTLLLLDKKLNSQTFHFAPAEQISWFDFAGMIFAQASIEIDLKPIPTSDYPTPAQRPLNSRLDTKKLQLQKISFPPIQESLQNCLKRLSS